MFNKLYALPIYTYVLAFVILIVFWIIISCVMYKYNKQKVWKIINLVLFVISVILILTFTVFRRTPGSNSEVLLNPLTLFYRGREQPETYRSIFMNIELFIPFGMFLPYLFKSEKTSKVFLLTLLIGLACSVMVETIQFIFAFGQADTADVLCNVFGVFIGSLAYVTSTGVIRRINN